jgi:hypothetical protein
MGPWWWLLACALGAILLLVTLRARLYAFWVTPPRPFEQTPPPPPPQYSNHGPRNWAAFPGRGDDPRLNAAEIWVDGEVKVPEADRKVSACTARGGGGLGAGKIRIESHHRLTASSYTLPATGFWEAANTGTR